MNEVVRRKSTELNEIGEEIFPERKHHQGILLVESQLFLSLTPQLTIKWKVKPKYWSKGYSLMIFRNTTGFYPRKRPVDLRCHGQLIVEASQDDQFIERLGAGTYYYTVVLHKRLFGLLENPLEVARFSETIPSDEIALKRVGDRVELNRLVRKDKLSSIKFEARMSELEVDRIEAQRKLEVEQRKTPQPMTEPNSHGPFDRDVAATNLFVQAVLQRRRTLAEVESDDAFKKLDPEDQELIRKAIRRNLDPGTISARQEMRGG